MPSSASTLTPDGVKPSSAYLEKMLQHPLPLVLRVPQRKLRTGAAMFGIVAGVLMSLAIYRLATPGTGLHRLFDLSDVSSGISVLVVVLTFWGLGLCWLRWQTWKAVNMIASPRLLRECIAHMRQHGAAALAQRLQGPVVEASPLLKRLQAVLHQWSLTPTLQEADVILSQHVTGDEDAVVSAYTLVRTFIWSLPALGLIGTVVGISAAVGDFAQFLSGNIDDVGVIKQNLIGVTGGLSFAFLTTLEGLLTSLLLMLAASALQNKEEQFYTDLQQQIVDDFLPELQRTAPSASLTTPESVSLWEEKLTAISMKVMQQVQAAGAAILAQAAAQQSEQRGIVEQWAQTLQKETHAGAERFREAGAHLAASLAEHMRPLQTSFDNGTEKLTGVVATLTATSNDSQERFLTALRQQVAALEGATHAQSSLNGTTRQILETQTNLQRTLEGSPIESFLGQYAGAMSLQTQQVQSATEALQSLSTLTAETLAAQKSLHQAMEHLDSTGFTGTLQEFQTSLASLGTVLEGFRQPFVLQAVPMAPASTVESRK
jgi:biopolymer transport protein ExbB/TolQ